MLVLNTSDPLNVLLLLAATILLMLLGKEIKKSLGPQLILIMYLVLLVFHAVQLVTINPQYTETITVIARSLAVDFSLILVSYLSYLWIDDIEAKDKKKKSIDNSLEWFWKKV